MPGRSSGWPRRPKGMERASAGAQLVAVLAFAAELAEQRRIGRAGADDVDADLLPGELPGHRLREGDQAALAEGVDGFARGADARGVRRDVDDASSAPLDHALQHRVMHVERPVQVDRDDPLPQILVGVEEGSGPVPAGVVDHDVDGAEFALDAGHGGDHRLLAGQVDRIGTGGAARLPDGAGHRFGGVLVDVEDRDGSALLTETPADRRPDAAGAAGDDRHLTIDSSHFPFSWFIENTSCNLYRMQVATFCP